MLFMGKPRFGEMIQFDDMFFIWVENHQLLQLLCFVITLPKPNSSHLESVSLLSDILPACFRKCIFDAYDSYTMQSFNIYSNSLFYPAKVVPKKGNQ